MKKKISSRQTVAKISHSAYRCARAVGNLTVGEFTVTGVPLFLFAFLVSSWEMDGKTERRWLGTSPCDNERTIALRKNALRAYERKSSELILPGPRSRVGTFWEHLSDAYLTKSVSLNKPKKSRTRMDKMKRLPRFNFPHVFNDPQEAYCCPYLRQFIELVKKKKKRGAHISRARKTWCQNCRV